MALFPSGIAEGEAFCNRTLERQRLGKNIENIRHTVLMAPRRYGKTSLIRQVILDNDFNSVWVDFLSVTTKEEVEEKIKKAGKALIFQLAPELRKLQLQTKDLVKSMSPELNLGAMGQSLTLRLNTDESISIDEMLLQIDQYAQKVGKLATLVFDEFQQVSEIKQNNAIEALIRHAVERSKAITYVFSGSNRHMLGDMFSRSNRPLYRLCQVMVIDRISDKEYIKFIDEAAQKQWGDSLPKEVLLAITRLTECHPFYVNTLCSDLWLSEAMPKTVEEVEKTWRWYVDSHKSIIVADMVALPLNQKKIIAALAQETTQEPYGAEFSFRTRISSSSIRRSIETLLGKDIICLDDKKSYRVLDPAVRSYLLRDL